MYTPNFNDMRIKRKMKSALGMTLGCLSADTPRPLGTRFIDRHFGQGQHQLSRWMRSELLTCTDESYNMDGGKCKHYVRNTAGCQKFIDYLDYDITPETAPALEASIVHEWMTEKFCRVEDIQYEDKSNRLWCDQQNVRKSLRNNWLSQQGLTRQYDINCAAPTLLYQKSWEYSGGLVLETIDYYIENKAEIRRVLAAETELPVDVVKRLLNALFAGAVIGANPQFAIYNMVNQDTAVIRYLQQDPFVQALVSDIREMWTHLKPAIPFRQARWHGELKFKTDGSPWRAPINSRDKWNIYFQLERSVLNSIRDYLDHLGVRYFLIHDAFVSDELPNGITDLQMWIERNTGFNLNFDEDILSTSLLPSV